MINTCHHTHHFYVGSEDQTQFTMACLPCLLTMLTQLVMLTQLAMLAQLYMLAHRACTLTTLAQLTLYWLSCLCSQTIFLNEQWQNQKISLG